MMRLPVNACDSDGPVALSFHRSPAPRPDDEPGSRASRAGATTGSRYAPAMDEDGGLRVNIHLEPVLSTHLEYGIEHIHEDATRVPMTPSDDGAGQGSSVDAINICSACGVQIHVAIEVDASLAGMQRFDSLVRVADAASSGHIPPDHQYGMPSIAGCQLCDALDKLTAPVTGDA